MQTLSKFNTFVIEILQNSSRLYKESVLKKYKDDEDIKYYLNFLYNPYITTGISSKAYQRFHNDACIDSYPTNIFKTAREALEYLKLHNTSDYSTRELMFSFYMKAASYSISHLNNLELSDLFYKLITKNLQLGIDSKTINKIIPNLIPTFNVQLSNKYFEKPELVEFKEFALTTKIDGGRIIALKENGAITFYTRQGQVYEGLVDLEAEMLEKLPDNICLDGELVAIKTNKEDTYKNTMKLARTKEQEKHGLKMLVFDFMTAEQFKNQNCNIPYISRRTEMFEAFAKNIPDISICTAVAIGCEPYKYYNGIIKFLNSYYSYFEILPYLYTGNDTAKILEILDEQVNKGEEGIMINILDAPYDFKRSNNLLKVKKMQTLDLEVIGFEQGTNKNADRLGALLVRYKEDNIVKVGSGFDYDLRKEIWDNQDKWLGVIIEVQYFEETQNQNGGISLRFPVFKDIRTDKDIADF